MSAAAMARIRTGFVAVALGLVDGPGVVGGRRALAVLGLALGALLALGGALSALAVLLARSVLRDLGNGVGEVRRDGADEEGRPLVLLAVFLPALGAEVAGDDDLHALGQGLGGVLGEALPDGAADEERVAVLPLLGLLVEATAVEGERNGRDGLSGLSEAELGVAGETANAGQSGQRQGQFSFVVSRSWRGGVVGFCRAPGQGSP